jgi:hypothetical protein
MRRTAEKKGTSDINNRWWEDKEDGYSSNEFSMDLDCDYDFAKDIAKRICNKVLGDSFCRRRPNITKRRNVAKREKKGTIMSMNRGPIGRKILFVTCLMRLCLLCQIDPN